MKAPPILVGTRNNHKIAELRALLAPLPVQVLGPADLGLTELDEEAELEPFDTFEQNALSKAKYFHVRSGLPTLADDSGLCVDALRGAPGVRTRRFAPDECISHWGEDEANCRWLLHVLEGVPPRDRGAEYRCAIAVTDETTHEVVHGTVRGAITSEASSGEGGFGYDPLFVPDGYDRTYADLAPSVKEETSHRALALRLAYPWLRANVLRF